MSLFNYRAKNSQNQDETGVIEAASAPLAARLLSEKGLMPILIQTAPASKASGKIDPLDVLLFTQQMHSLLKAGVPILRSLSGIEESASNPAFARVVQSIRNQLETGRELFVSLGKHSAAFDPFYISMVRVGEQTGKLESVFEKLKHHLLFQKQMRELTKTALRYPIMVIGVMIAALLIINFFVIPAFSKVYSGFHTELPLFTKMLVGASTFLVNTVWVWALGAVFGGFLFKGWLATKSGHLVFDRLILRAPVAGDLLSKIAIARFSRSLSLSLQAGVPVANALPMVADTVGNAWIQRKLSELLPAIEKGESLLKAARDSGIFSPIALQMIMVGEESGSLDEMLGEVADLYESQIEYQFKTLSSQIEPFLLLFLGGLVLILALGVFLPIWNLGSAAMGRNPT